MIGLFRIKTIIVVVFLYDAHSLNAFKNSLSRIRDNRMGFFVD